MAYRERHRFRLLRWRKRSGNGCPSGNGYQSQCVMYSRADCWYWSVIAIAGTCLIPFVLYRQSILSVTATFCIGKRFIMRCTSSHAATASSPYTLLLRDGVFMLSRCRILGTFICTNLQELLLVLLVVSAHHAIWVMSVLKISFCHTCRSCILLLLRIRFLAFR